MDSLIDISQHPFLTRHGDFCTAMNTVLKKCSLPANVSFPQLMTQRIELVFSSKNLNLTRTKRGNALEILFIDSLIKMGVATDRILDHIRIKHRKIEFDVVIIPVNPHLPVMCISLKTSIRERGMPTFDREAIALTLNLGNVWTDVAEKIGVGVGAARIYYGVMAREDWGQPPKHAIDRAREFATAAFNIDDDKLISIYDEQNMMSLINLAVAYNAVAAE